MGRKMSELYERLNGQDYFIPSDKPRLLSVAGIIGVGKTTLAKGLAVRLGAAYIPEKYDDNPYLSDVYDGHAELALDSELFFLSSGASQLTKKLLEAGSCYVSDYVFDKAMIYASAWLKGADFHKYLKHYNSVKEAVAGPLAVIYLQDTLEHCLQRIHKRNRPYEQHIEIDFLRHLANGYDALYTDYTVCPVIRLHANECLESEQVDRLSDELQFYLKDLGRS
jgi:deoxyadenosine/deoxycytidine kinase